MILSICILFFCSIHELYKAYWSILFNKSYFFAGKEENLVDIIQYTFYCLLCTTWLKVSSLYIYKVLQNITKSEFDIWYLIHLLHLLCKEKKTLVEVSQSCTYYVQASEDSGVISYKGCKIAFVLQILSSFNPVSPLSWCTVLV